MAVYTEVGFDAVDALVRRLHLGALTDLQGIRSGIENTNYFATTTGGQWVLTLFERLPAEQLPYYLRLMRHLAEHGVPVPAPQADADGQMLHMLAGKPAAVVTRLPGSHRLHPDENHCSQLGAVLARMHLAVATLPVALPHPRDLTWCQSAAASVLRFLSVEQRDLLRDELAVQQGDRAGRWRAALPQGAIHADLFRDNVMFDDTAGPDRLCGIFDFYFAGTDALIFDLAVCLNDWCLQGSGPALDDARARALLHAYGAVRALQPAEVDALPLMLRAAALRFWLSRLQDGLLPRDASLLQAKDPAHFEAILRQRIDQPWNAEQACAAGAP